MLNTNILPPIKSEEILAQDDAETVEERSDPPPSAAEEAEAHALPSSVVFKLLDSNTNSLECAPATARYVLLKNHALIPRLRFTQPKLLHSELMFLERPSESNFQDSTVTTLNANKLDLMYTMNCLSRSQPIGSQRPPKLLLHHTAAVARSSSSTYRWATTAAKETPLLLNPLLRSTYDSSVLVTPRLEQTDCDLFRKSLHRFNLNPETRIYLNSRLRQSSSDNICWPDEWEAQQLSQHAAQGHNIVGLHRDLFSTAAQFPDGSLLDLQRQHLLSNRVQQFSAAVDNAAVKWREDTLFVPSAEIQSSAASNGSVDPFRVPATAVVDLFRSKLHLLNDSSIQSHCGRVRYNKTSLLQQAVEFIEVASLSSKRRAEVSHADDTAEATAATAAAATSGSAQKRRKTATSQQQEQEQYVHFERTAARHLEGVADALIEQMLQYFEPYATILNKPAPNAGCTANNNNSNNNSSNNNNNSSSSNNNNINNNTGNINSGSSSKNNNVRKNSNKNKKKSSNNSINNSSSNQARDLFTWEHVLRSFTAATTAAVGEEAMTTGETTADTTASLSPHPDLPELQLSQALLLRVQRRVCGLFAGGTVQGPPRRVDAAVLQPDITTNSNNNSSSSKLQQPRNHAMPRGVWKGV